MILKLCIVLSLIYFVMGSDSEEYDLLFDILEDVEDDDVGSNEAVVTVNDVPKLSNGSWVCGECDSIPNLIYTELNQVDWRQEEIEIQISISAEGMRCVIISGPKVGVLTVTRGSGSCSGDDVSLVLKGGESGRAGRDGDVTFLVSAYGGDGVY